MLETYDWPDNVAELESALGHAWLRSSGPELAASDLPENVIDFFRAKEATHDGSLIGADTETESAMPEMMIPLADAERRLILGTVQRLGGNAQAAAVVLGIGKTTVYRKLKEYQLSESGSTASSLKRFAGSDTHIAEESA
jgi:two-component system response regulator HydG